jgi:hypothetical protein
VGRARHPLADLAGDTGPVLGVDHVAGALALRRPLAGVEHRLAS